jgi:ASC-1-like (ASCH) protein/ribosomal protein S18 acetylase RimI-like enzyme
MTNKEPTISIQEAKEEDFDFVTNLMCEALEPYYGGDHRAHAQRIFRTHISGGKDQLGFFSFEQKMFIITVDGKRAGMIHLVGKRQGTYKISPIIVVPEFRKKLGLGKRLLEFAENYAKSKGARQIYCTVAEQNKLALEFFIQNGYIIAGRSDSHYKAGITEVMLYKLFTDSDFDDKFDRMHISVLPFEDKWRPQVRQLLLDTLPKCFRGIDSDWVDSLFEGWERRHSRDINLKYKLIYVAVDRNNTVVGVAGATPKKSGLPVKVMPFVARNLQAFIALLIDVPYFLKAYGNKLYIHITPTVEETIALQQYGWRLDALMPAGYHEDLVTQQWSIDVTREDFIRPLRTKQHYLDLIKSGQKTLEVRVGYEHIKTIEPGELIKFCSRTGAIVARVKDVRKYSTLSDMIKHEEANQIIPGLPESEVLKILREIYPPAFEKLGVVVLEIQVEHGRYT